MKKDSTTWQPKHSAYRKRSSLLFTMIQVTLLISRKKNINKRLL
ncbi:hypothetical protein [Romboutsia lituseburensis]|nr:hypothetical protein [Romboutsia lituseburensis]